MSHETFIRRMFPRQWVRNPDYESWGSRYAHIEIWRRHHGVNIDPTVYVIHHKNLDKKDNSVCDEPEPCTVWDCGNLAAMTRADHIREHRPGKMSGAKGFVDTKPRKLRGSPSKS